jgi:hypothetical protein
VQARHTWAARSCSLRYLLRDGVAVRWPPIARAPQALVDGLGRAFMDSIRGQGLDVAGAKQPSRGVAFRT